MNPKPANDPLDALLAAATPAVRATAIRVRAVVRAALPDATERLLPGWGAIGFRHPDAGHICALFPRTDEVRLYFEHGGELPDPEGAPLGRTGRSSYAYFRRAADVKRTALAPLVQQAFLAAVRHREVRRAARPPRRRR